VSCLVWILIAVRRRLLELFNEGSGVRGPTGISQNGILLSEKHPNILEHDPSSSFFPTSSKSSHRIP
jgi:hypothetical protein